MATFSAFVMTVRASKRWNLIWRAISAVVVPESRRIVSPSWMPERLFHGDRDVPEGVVAPQGAPVGTHQDAGLGQGVQIPADRHR